MVNLLSLSKINTVAVLGVTVISPSTNVESCAVNCSFGSSVASSRIVTPTTASVAPGSKDKDTVAGTKSVPP